MTPKKLRAPNSLFSKKPSIGLFSEYFQTRVFQNNLGYNRFGVAVGLKVDKRSTRRHFWKRLILKNALLQKNFSSDFIITAKPALGTISKKQAESEIAGVFKKLKQ
ncbi:MAG: ribonuclease P protein component [Patescibacteria group bacterium]